MLTFNNVNIAACRNALHVKPCTYCIIYTPHTCVVNMRSSYDLIEGKTGEKVPGWIVGTRSGTQIECSLPWVISISIDVYLRVFFINKNKNEPVSRRVTIH